MKNPLDFLDDFSKRHKARYELWYVLADKNYQAEIRVNKKTYKAAAETAEKAAEDIIEQLRQVKGLRIRYKEKDDGITGTQEELF